MPKRIDCPPEGQSLGLPAAAGRNDFAAALSCRRGSGKKRHGRRVQSVAQASRQPIFLPST
jgi:hypothetical protein